MKQLVIEFNNTKDNKLEYRIKKLDSTGKPLENSKPNDYETHGVLIFSEIVKHHLDACGGQELR